MNLLMCNKATQTQACKSHKKLQIGSSEAVKRLAPVRSAYTVLLKA